MAASGLGIVKDKLERCASWSTANVDLDSRHSRAMSCKNPVVDASMGFPVTLTVTEKVDGHWVTRDTGKRLVQPVCEKHRVQYEAEERKLVPFSLQRSAAAVGLFVSNGKLYIRRPAAA